MSEQHAHDEPTQELARQTDTSTFLIHAQYEALERYDYDMGRVDDFIAGATWALNQQLSENEMDTIRKLQDMGLDIVSIIQNVNSSRLRLA